MRGCAASALNPKRDDENELNRKKMFNELDECICIRVYNIRIPSTIFSRVTTVLWFYFCFVAAVAVPRLGRPYYYCVSYATMLCVCVRFFI